MDVNAAGSATPYTVVIPVLDQLHYTQQCVHSLVAHGVPTITLQPPSAHRSAAGWRRAACEGPL